MRARWIVLALPFALGGFSAAPRDASAATIVIINSDDAGEGFNDATPVAPVGGNNGTTRGAQRLNVFNQAAAIWGGLIPSNVTIRVRAWFDPLTCSGGTAVLGSAGPATIAANFSDTAFPDTWYHVALANRIAGRDLDATSDDIFAFFNSTVDEAGCLGASDWYYGFDHQHGDDQDLYAVVLHELGHGLGFSTFVNVSTGELLRGNDNVPRPDVFLQFIYDDAMDLPWVAMTNTQRAQSATNNGHVVWTGAATTAEAATFLEPGLLFQITTPPLGTREARIAEFGPRPPASPLTADVVLVDDGVAPTSDACTPIVNAAQVAGKLALIDRGGGCSFVNKALAAELAGAVGVIIANNVAGDPPGMSGSAPGLAIPVVSITLADGNTIKSALGSGVVQATIARHPSRRAGTNPVGEVLLYAPSTLSVGSSISHFDVTATPNLLMEPFASDDLGSGVDLTLQALEDIGWFGGGGGGVDTPPAVVEVLSGYPNPFGAPTTLTTTLRFLLDRRVDIEATIHDIHGRRVKTLTRGARDPGEHTLVWDGLDDDGNAARSGVYLFRVNAGDATDAKRIVLTR